MLARFYPVLWMGSAKRLRNLSNKVALSHAFPPAPTSLGAIDAKRFQTREFSARARRRSHSLAFVSLLWFSQSVIAFDRHRRHAQ